MCKIPLETSLTCPNRDGTKGFGGCTFCTGDGGAGAIVEDFENFADQYQKGCHTMRQKWKDAGFIAYFQTFSNTYCSVEKLNLLVEDAFALPLAEELSIATRCDCLDEEKIALLAKKAMRIPITIELGLQTIHEKTAMEINRGHSFEEFVDCFSLLKDYKLPVCVHLINGLPNESPQDMVETARVVGKLYPRGVKLHMLHLVEGAKLAEEYIKKPFYLLSKEEYVEIITRQLELLPPEIVIERITGDGMASSLIAPLWTKKKLSVINDIDKALIRKDSFQGKFFKE